MESAEAEQTHADMNYVTNEDAEPEYPIILGPFSPKSYNPLTGIMVIPSTLTPSVAIEVGMTVVDSNGVGHIITDTIDTEDDFTFILTPNDTVADFSKALIKNTLGSLTVTLESIQFRETYQIGCHVQGESFFLTYLHSIMIFILAGRYKQALLEARGFERSTLSSSQFLKNDALGVENAYSRFINITGYVRQVWPKFVGTKTTKVNTAGIGVSFGISGSNGPPGNNDKGVTQTDEDPWGVDKDALLIPTR
jgi:hypothetical protein